jgi:hypothetical protein
MHHDAFRTARLPQWCVLHMPVQSISQGASGGRPASLLTPCIRGARWPGSATARGHSLARLILQGASGNLLACLARSRCMRSANTGPSLLAPIHIGITGALLRSTLHNIQCMIYVQPDGRTESWKNRNAWSARRCRLARSLARGARIQPVYYTGPVAYCNHGRVAAVGAPQDSIQYSVHSQLEEPKWPRLSRRATGHAASAARHSTHSGCTARWPSRNCLVRPALSRRATGHAPAPPVLSVRNGPREACEHWSAIYVRHTHVACRVRALCSYIRPSPDPY